MRIPRQLPTLINYNVGDCSSGYDCWPGTSKPEFDSPISHWYNARKMIYWEDSQVVKDVGLRNISISWFLGANPNLPIIMTLYRLNKVKLI